MSIEGEKFLNNEKNDSVEMNLIEWSSISQVVIAVLTLIGILVSLYMSRKALREVKLDRQLRQAPYLSFETGGVRIPIIFLRAGRRIPGFSPEYIEQIFREMPENAESIRIKHNELEGGEVKFLQYGHLINYGLGTALKSIIFWKPKKIRIGNELFNIDGDKLKEPKYMKGLNRTYPDTRNIKPNQETSLIWLPVFIEKDYEKKIMEAWGEIEIKCNDVSNLEYEWIQYFYIKTGYDNDHPYVHITFSDSAFA